MAGARMKAAEKPLAWRKRQGTASEQVRADLDETIQAKRAKEAAKAGDFAVRLAAIRRDFDKDDPSAWHGPASVSMCMGTGLVLADGLKAALTRIDKLEKQLSEQKTITTHHEKHAVRFAGTFVMENAYGEGALVTYKGLCYIAARDISANLAFPPRQGSGWIPLA